MQLKILHTEEPSTILSNLKYEAVLSLLLIAEPGKDESNNI